MANICRMCISINVNYGVFTAVVSMAKCHIFKIVHITFTYLHNFPSELRPAIENDMRFDYAMK